MAFRLTPGPGRGPNPSTVPGFERARVLGLLPSVPTDPPTPVVPNSRTATRYLFAFTAAMFVAMPVAEWVGLTFLVPGFLAMAGILAGIFVPSRLMAAEFAAGYTRVDEHLGVAVIDWKLRFQNQAGPSGAEWDLRGLWLLDADDKPVRAPVPEVLPPGRYPSPHRRGQLEYWTGRDWYYGYQQPAHPFLESAN